MEYSSKNQSRNVLAIARWEDNEARWLKGDFFGFASKTPYLQKIVGQGGTLWLVVSRKMSNGRRQYRLMFKFVDCRLETYDENSRFGRYVVLGDPNKSVLYASNNSELLLMSLRFSPSLPIKDVGKIGNSIQRPRILSKSDVGLLENQMLNIDRWSVFLSYKSDDSIQANKLYSLLTQLGINLFQDHVSIKAGSDWQRVLLDAVSRSRCLVILIGEKTHQSDWVKKEVHYAISNRVPIIPVLIGGSLNNWQGIAKLPQIQSIKGAGKSLTDVAQEIVLSLR